MYCVFWPIAIVDTLDQSVGTITEALSQAGMLGNSIIIFASDNGGAPDGFDMNYASNWPLRGVCKIFTFPKLIKIFEAFNVIDSK